MDKQSRVPELDAVRGIAALAIVATHLPHGFWFGETGVDLFFVMSGFLITSIISKHLAEPRFLRSFLARRSLRIWPIYYLALLGVFGLSLLRRTPSNNEGWWHYALYVQNVGLYWGQPTPPFAFSIGHTWTLAIEEQFYILWPILLLVFGRRAIFPLGIALVLAPIAIRHAGINRVTLLGHTDGFGWGAILSVLNSSGTGARRQVKRLAAVGAAGLAGYLLHAGWLLTSGATGKAVIADNAAIALINVIYFAVVGLTIARAGQPELSVLRWRPLVYLGQVSYGLYLYHWILYEQLDHVFKFGMGYHDPLWLDALKVLLSMAAAIASWHLIEKPILSLKRRFKYNEPLESQPPVQRLAASG